jgi:hypothetical protein
MTGSIELSRLNALAIIPLPRRSTARPSAVHTMEPPMNKIAVFSELESIVQFRLFGDGHWLADGETSRVLERRIIQMAVREPEPGTSHAGRATRLNVEFNFRL